MHIIYYRCGALLLKHRAIMRCRRGCKEGKKFVAEVALEALVTQEWGYISLCVTVVLTLELILSRTFFVVGL